MAEPDAPAARRAAVRARGAARVLAAGSGGRGYQFLSLALLLVLVAAPVVSLGGTQPVALGLRPDRAHRLLPVARAAAAAAGARDRGDAGARAGGRAPARRRPPTARSRGSTTRRSRRAFGPDEPLSFDWGHSYGPITWPRDGAEVLRVDTRRPSYWKIADLDDFDGETWVDTGADDAGSAAPELDLARDWKARPSWRETLRVTLRRIETDDVIGAGTTLEVEDTSRDVAPSGRGRAVALGHDVPCRRLLHGARAYVAAPDARTARGLDVGAGRAPRGRPGPGDPDRSRGRQPAGGAGLGERCRGRCRRRPRAAPAAAARGGPLRAVHAERPRARAVRQLPDARAVQRRRPCAAPVALRGDLAAREAADAPVLDAVRVRRRRRPLPAGRLHLRRDGPTPVSPGRATLDGFLFETKSGYCQHFSGAMALLLRMGGVPARVATGFSPGGYSKRKRAWIVRDTDAHSWVEAWFDDYGWVTFDPTPAGTPGAVADRRARPRGRDERRLGRRRRVRRRLRCRAPAASVPTCSVRSRARAARERARPRAAARPGGGSRSAAWVSRCSAPGVPCAGAGAASARPRRSTAPSRSSSAALRRIGRPDGGHDASPARAAPRRLAGGGRVPARAALGTLRDGGGAADAARAAGTAARAGEREGPAWPAPGAVGAAALAVTQA